MQYQPNVGAQAPPRMAYSGMQHPRQQEQMARQELLSGAQPVPAQAQQQLTVDEMNTRQLMQHAVETHKDTTTAAKRSLQTVEQMREIQATTHAALYEQGQQMSKIETDMAKIGEDLSYSERILKFMQMCCCFSFFCACCTEPARNEKDKAWRGLSGSDGGYDNYAAPGQQRPQKLTAAQKKKQKQEQEMRAQGPSAAYPGVSTQGLSEVGFGQEAASIEEETKVQDQYLDQISKGLDQLKLGAQRMNQEMHMQEAQATRIGQDAETLHSKLRSVNREGFRRI